MRSVTRDFSHAGEIHVEVLPAPHTPGIYALPLGDAWPPKGSEKFRKSVKMDLHARWEG